MDEIILRDQNHVTVLAGVTDDIDQDIKMLRVDPITKRLLVQGQTPDLSGYVPYLGATDDVYLGIHSLSTPLVIGGTGVTDTLSLKGTSGNGTLTSPAIQALVGNNGATTAYTVLNNGNVGIGTVDPSATLEVYGAGQLTAALTDAGVTTGMLSLNDSRANAGAGGTITFGNVQSITAGSVGFAAIKGLLTNGNSNTQGDLAFSTRNAQGDTALTERMRITSGGNVGIGTNAPSAKEHILGTTEQLRLGYDVSNYFSTTVGSSGGVTFNAVGASSAFTFSDPVTINGNLTLGTAGNKINITEGTNATVGQATLVGGTVTINTTAVTANSRIFLTDAGGTITNLGTLYVGTITAGTSFVINSSNILDASNVNWLIIN